MRLAKYDYIAKHVPGKLLYAADALSRAPTQGESEEELQEEVEAYVDHVTMSSIPATAHRLQAYRQAQMEDAEDERASTPYFSPNFLYRVKVYSNERPPWSELRVEFEKHSMRI